MKNKIKIRDLLLTLGLVIAAVVLFFSFFKDNGSSVPQPEKPRSLSTSNNGQISASSDEKWIGVVSTRGSAIMVQVFDQAGKLIFEDSLTRFNPHQVTAYNRITFSPDGRFGALAVNDLRNNLDSRVFLIDLSRKEIIDLGTKGRWADLAYCYECQDGPVWLDNSTLAFVHRLGTSAQELVFVDLNTGKEILPRKQFFYNPALSHSKNTLACHATGQDGKTQVVLIGLEKENGRIVSTTDRILAGPFRNVSHFAWSPDDQQLAFSYMDEESSQKGISPVVVHDVDTGKFLFRISDYVSSPQWLDNKYLMTGHWVATPFAGQNVHTFSGFLVFDVPAGLVTDMTIKAQNENLAVLPSLGKIVTADDGGLIFKDINSIFSSMPEYESRVADVVEDSHKMAGLKGFSLPTFMGTWFWKSYHNDNFGISFKYPPDWKLLAASGDGYMNLGLGKGLDGIEISVATLPERPVPEPGAFEEALLAMLAQKSSPYANKDLVKVKIGGREFFRATSEGTEESTLNLTYYLNAPVVGQAFPQWTDVMIFSLKSFTEDKTGADPDGEENPSHKVLKVMLSTVKIDRRK